MNFHLQFPITAFPDKMNYDHSSLFMGSCFAENIGGLLEKYKFKVQANPNGILYNPLSIAAALRRYMENDQLKEDDLFFTNSCWNSWEHHSRFSDPDKKKCLSGINDRINSAHHFLKNAEWLFITFGSAFVYEKDGKKVANCHKQPQKGFAKKLISTSEIIEEYKQLISALKVFNPSLKIVFTISPVRYIRDGVVENNLSKAKLIDAVHSLAGENILYFPAYELMVDDLRDYRFYGTDMVHPNEQAIGYIFDKLKAAAFSEETHPLFEKIKEILAAKEHKAFHAGSQAHEKFKTTYYERCLDLNNTYPSLDLKEELSFFKNSPL